MNKYFIVGIILMSLFVIGCEQNITNFEECIAAGNPAMESYPRQCRAGDRTFREEIEVEAHTCTEEEKAAEICTLDYTPVCGDDGVTYGNACQACSSGEIDSYVMGECPKPIGGERDEHGCLGAAGYSWNEEVGACVREWELDDNQKKAAKIAVTPLSYSVTVVEVQTARCPGCFSVKLQRNDNQEQLTVSINNWKLGETTYESEGLTYEQAVAIAKTSECTEKGTLTDVYIYNENTKTWWIDLTMKPEFAKDYCNPACVVNEETNTAEINWRCTGLLPPK